MSTDVNNIYSRKDTVFCSIYGNYLNRFLSGEKDIYISEFLEKPLVFEECLINARENIKDNIQQYESLQKFYVPPYIRGTANTYTQYPNSYFLEIYLMEKIKHFIYLIEFSKNDFFVLSEKISGRFRKRTMINNKFLFFNTHKRDFKIPECVNFLQKLYESNLSSETKNCYKNSMIYSGCQSIFDIPCLCISNTYKSAVATCIYQKTPFDLLSSYEFSSVICSKYLSLPTSCISSLIENRENIYITYDYKEKDIKAFKNLINKDHCKDIDNRCSGC
ncbi:hypothetical protein PMAC_003159 [Pneumocystis sp. 'macacae']|nr:hypothetical protein PMAC_003159 [Pneumocystis sp. 'macacae']